MANFHSQHGQDRFLLDKFFRGRREGVFCEIGEAAGEFSNTRFFEHSMGWRRLSIRRDEESKLSQALLSRGLREIDYLAISRGANLPEVLAGLDRERPEARVISVSDVGGGSAIMEQIGYTPATMLGRDTIFARRDVAMLPQVSVICAVWHGDRERLERLKGHVENLARQSVKIEPIYVFDGGDDVPSWLGSRAVVTREDLTIYQAWNAALSMVATPLVMNLNLDDRLAPDAVGVLAMELTRGGGIAAGGDWKVCYSQIETDAVERCYPAERVPFIAEWPPAPGSFRRLGCGTHNFGSLGPATMWRMDAHINVPRYPWRFGEGTPIRCAADLAWWSILTNGLRGKVVRVPMIIGHYFSHPEDQAEFRKPPYDETQLLDDPGVARI